jgi:hypothetical protein
VTKFIHTLWSGRDRKRRNAQLQERIAAYSLFRPHPARNVWAAPQRPPVKEKTK